MLRFLPFLELAASATLLYVASLSPPDSGQCGPSIELGELTLVRLLQTNRNLTTLLVQFLLLQIFALAHKPKSFANDFAGRLIQTAVDFLGDEFLKLGSQRDVD